MATTDDEKTDIADLIKEGLWRGSDSARSELERRGREAVPHLIKVLSDNSCPYRWWAINALGDLEDQRAVEPLIAALGDDEADAVRWAVSSLGRLEDPRAVDPVIKTLKHADREVREHAVVALGFLEDRRAVEPLIEVLLEDPSWYARCQAADVLGRFKDARAVPALVKALAYDKESWQFMVKAAAQALAEIDAPLGLEPLVAVLGRGLPPSDAGWVASYLASLCRHDKAAVLKGLASPAPAVRAGCAAALEKAGDEACVAPLLRLLKDPAKPVREAARSTLKAMRKRGAPVDVPSQDPWEMAADAGRWLMENYFVVPGTEGFSAYRTGAAVHWMFSVLVCMAVVVVAARLGVVAAPVVTVAAAAAVFLLWGAGVWVGVMSHYNPLITLAALASLVVLAKVLPKQMAVAGVAGVLAHAASWAAVRLLMAAYVRANPRLKEDA
ncbi:MAG: HEAT repeat domain-containing protein [Elusimicrobia bacterium]|nr:HEAT repeat domain-containing protein [Elusimicrobiota bacterium]